MMLSKKAPQRIRAVYAELPRLKPITVHSPMVYTYTKGESSSCIIFVAILGRSLKKSPGCTSGINDWFAKAGGQNI